MKIIIVGKSASGKDYLFSDMKHFNHKCGIKYTTRPKRLKETEGVEYRFIDNETFDKLNIIVSQSFTIINTIWNYGYTYEDFETNDVFILTPAEIKLLSSDIRNQFTVIYLNIDIDTRLHRIRSRNENMDDAERRINSDELDFKDFKDFDIEITDTEFNYANVIDLIYKNKH